VFSLAGAAVIFGLLLALEASPTTYWGIVQAALGAILAEAFFGFMRYWSSL
jgi:hypothetical protein